MNAGDAFRLGHELRLFTDVPVWPLKIEDMRRAIVRAAAEIGRTLWIPNTQTEDGCPIDTSQLVFVIYDNDDIDSGIAGTWHESWNTTRELYIKGYRIINDY